MNCSSALAQYRKRKDLRFAATGCMLLSLTLSCALAGRAEAQVRPQPPDRVLQLGLAAIPGAGVVAGYVSPRGPYTVGAMVYADATPPFSGGEGSLQVSLGLGGSIRPLGIVRLVANTGYTGYDVDIGIRAGPSLFFPYGTSSRERNPFSLFIEPFFRFESILSSGRNIFVELGLQRPILRSGLWIRF